MILDFPNRNYKKWAILQRIAELKKAIARRWTKEREDELSNLERDLRDE